MHEKLPAWVGAGAFSLALSAGVVNVFTFVSIPRQAVSHHSGNATMMMLALAQGSWEFAGGLGALILAFFLGSVVSGAIIRDYHLKLGRRYGLCLMAESLAILVAWSMFRRLPYLAQLILAAASGLQNALATTYSGAVIRTTHLTGLFTDLGIALGHSLAGIAAPKRKVELLLAILAGFLSGALISGLLYPRWGAAVLAVPAAITGAAGVGYFAYRHRAKGRRSQAV